MAKEPSQALTNESIDALVQDRLRVVTTRLLADRARASVPMTRARRKLFLDVLANGGSVAFACEAAGISGYTAYRARRLDPKFAEAWAEAIEASCAPLEEALMQTAIYAPLDSMARVRAAESLLAARSPAYRRGGGGAAVTMRRNADGDSITLALGTPGPD